MFFSQIILVKRGPLGRIWLAGHWDKKIAKNVVFKTNITQSIKKILHPHLPMALRMTSHLLLGVVRIYSKKAKYLLQDCSEAVSKLKGLTKKITTAIPTADTVDPQSLLTTGPRSADASKPQVYKEVDRFLRNIDIRDLVMDSFYDPSMINPEAKQIPDNLQTPGGLGQTPGDLLGSVGRDSETGESASKKLKYQVELRDFERPDILSPGDIARGLQESPGLEQRSPIEMGSVNKSNLIEQLEFGFDPFNLDTIKTPPGGVQDDLNREDFNKPLDVSMIPGRIDFDQSPKGQGEGLEPIGFDDQGGGYDFGDDFGLPQPPQPQQQPDVEFTELSDEEKKRLREEEEAENINVTSTAAMPTAEKKKRQKRITQASISRKDKKRYENTKSLLIERNLLPFKQPTQTIIEKTRDLSPKHQMLAPIRIALSEKLMKFYEDTLQYKIPAIVGINSVLPLAYLRGRRSHYVVTRADSENGFLTSENRRPSDLGILQYTDYNHEEEKKREKIILASLNNRDLENEREPQGVPIIQPDDPREKEIYDEFMDEIKLRGEQGTSVVYHHDTSIEKLMRPKTPGQLEGISPYKDIPMIDETMIAPGSVRSKTSSTLKPLEEPEPPIPFDEDFPQGGYEDFGQYGGDDNLPPFQQPPVQEEEEELKEMSLEEQEKRKKDLKSKSVEQRKKIWSQKTSKMHTILNSYFKQSNQIKLLDDMVQVGQNRKRSVAAGIFYELLILKTKDLVNLSQGEPYGDIVIKKTDNFDHTYDWKIVDEKD